MKKTGEMKGDKKSNKKGKKIIKYQKGKKR
jgi:hypothetical protein